MKVLSTATLLALTALGVGCASGESAAERERLTDEQTEPRPARTIGQRASEALAFCRQEIDKIEQLHRDERVSFAVEVCSDIWLEEKCASSFEAALSLPSYLRSGKILRDCRDAYCPTFEPTTSESLALCNAPLEGPISLVQPLGDEDATDPIEAWSAFNDAIFSEVYGVTSDQQLIGSFPRMLLQLVVVAPPPGEQRSNPQ